MGFLNLTTDQELFCPHLHLLTKRVDQRTGADESKVLPFSTITLLHWLALIHVLRHGFELTTPMKFHVTHTAESVAAYEPNDL